MQPSAHPPSPLPALPCACACLRRAARVVTQLYDEALRPAGVRATQFALLKALAQGDPITQGDIGAALGIDSTTLSRSLRLLQRRGWVTGVPGRDRRERRFSLTAAGRKRLERAEHHWTAVQSRLRERLGDHEWRALHVRLDEVTRLARGA